MSLCLRLALSYGQEVHTMKVQLGGYRPPSDIQTTNCSTLTACIGKPKNQEYLMSIADTGAEVAEHQWTELGGDASIFFWTFPSFDLAEVVQ